MADCQAHVVHHDMIFNKEGYEEYVVDEMDDHMADVDVQTVSMAVDMIGAVPIQPGTEQYNDPTDLKRPPTLVQGDAERDEYAVDVFLWKYSQQRPVCNPMSVQPDVTWPMRKRVIRWLWRVNSHLGYSVETWCLTVALIDRFLSLQPLHPDCLQLISLTAFFVAAKLEEREPPVVTELVSLCASAYSSKQFDWMEKVLLNLLEFKLRTPTASFFLQHVVELERFSNCWPWPFSHALVQDCLCQCELVCSVLPAQLAHAIFSVVVDRFNVDMRIHVFAGQTLSTRFGCERSNQTFNVEMTEGHELLIGEYSRRVLFEVIQQMQRPHPS